MESLFLSNTGFLIMYAFVGLGFVLLTIRFFLGPTLHDRLVALESLTVVMLCFMGVLGLVFGTAWFFDAILVLAIVAFLSTVAIAKYLEAGDIIDD